jgi:hypothetical protein
MSRGLIFWVLMLVWFVFALLLNFGGQSLGVAGHYGTIANSLLEFVLFLLLGWQVYGAPVHS